MYVTETETETEPEQKQKQQVRCGCVNLGALYNSIKVVDFVVVAVSECARRTLR